MSRYTIAFDGDMLIGCVPYGEDIHADVERECREANIPVPEYEVVDGVVLTDDPSQGEVVFSSPGGKCGWLTDEDGTAYDYAVLP